MTQFIAAWPGVNVMRVNTSLGISACAISLLFWYWAKMRPATRWARWAAILLGIFATAIGGLTSLEYLTKTNLGIDTLFAAPTFPADQASRYVVAPGRMSLNAALSLFFLGLSVWGLDWTLKLGRRRKVFTAPIFAVIATLPACFGLVGYVSGMGGFTGLLKSTHILFHTASALLLVATGVLAIRPERQPVRRILSRSASGLLLRWLLPGSTLSLILLAYLIGKGRTYGLVAQGEGTALMLFGGLILLYTLIVSASRTLDEQEAKARRAKSALKEEEQRSRSILETSLDAIILMDADGRVEDWNLAAEQIFGWSRREMIGQLLSDHIVPERLRNRHSQALQNYLQSDLRPVIGRRLELPALRRDGTEFSVELSVNSMASHEDPMFVGFVRDITDRKKAEDSLRQAKEQAERASQAKDDFLAALSHELRTPLTPVLLSSSVLQSDDRLPEDVRHTLSMIERHVNLEARLIDDLLDLTRISRGKLLLRTEICDAHALIHHAWDIIRDDAESKKIHVQLNLSATRSRLKGDPTRLQQVLWNLLKNAVKFTPEAGSIHISSQNDEAAEQLILSIRDTGIGFAPDLANQLFLPFEQDKSGAHQFGGLGLGLAIARAIVELHGGHIDGHSLGYGEGAVFTIRLPCTPDSEVQPREKNNSQPIPNQTFEILLVEDHAPTRQVLARLLDRAGHRVISASSVTEALEMQAKHTQPLDILISDIGLPDGSGIDLMEQLRQQGIFIPGIALSGYGMDEDLQRTRAAGFHSHLVKPVKFEQLQLALSAIQHRN
jgi:PAS domain S-box-containing protein